MVAGCCPKLVSLAQWPLLLLSSFLAHSFYNFNIHNHAIGKTMVAPKTSKAATAWWLATKRKNMPLALKRHTSFRQNRTILDPASWKLSQTCDSGAVAFAVEFFGTLRSHLQQRKSCGWPRPGWLPRQANLPLHGGWRRTWQMCHWPWSVKSRIRKAQLPKHKPGSPWDNWWLHLFALHSLSWGPFLDSASWWLSQSCDSCRAAFALEIWAHLRQMASTACKNNCGTLLLQLQQTHPCYWQN